MLQINRCLLHRVRGLYINIINQYNVCKEWEEKSSRQAVSAAQFTVVLVLGVWRSEDADLLNWIRFVAANKYGIWKISLCYLWQ